MKLDTEPRLTEGATFFRSLIDILRKTAGVVNGNADAQGALIVQAAQPGHVALFGMSAAPAGWIKANGATISRTSYAALFAAIGTTFGAGDGLTTFNLPDARGEFLRGWDDSRGVDASRAFGSAQLDAMQGHQHQTNVSTGTVIGSPYNGLIAGISTSSGDAAGLIAVGNPTTDGANGTPRRAAETRPRNVALLACIKF